MGFYSIKQSLAINNANYTIEKKRLNQIGLTTSNKLSKLFMAILEDERFLKEEQRGN